MTDPGATRLAVLGSPIAHSLSPTLHAAAYRVLGLDWSYESFEITGSALSEFLDSRGTQWRGLSLTMPLKRDVIPLLDSVDRLANLTGVANTVRLDAGQRHGLNTDVAGITRSFSQSGVNTLGNVAVLGGGATAASALVASSELGAQSAQVWVRNPAKASALRTLADRLNIAVQIRAFTEIDGDIGVPDAIISTLPNGTVVDLHFSSDIRQRSVLFDVAYDPWPTPLASAWMEASGQVISGIEMLLNQAVVQVRVFLTGNPETELPEEESVMAAMRASVAGPWPVTR